MSKFEKNDVTPYGGNSISISGKRNPLILMSQGVIIPYMVKIIKINIEWPQNQSD